VKFLSDNFLLQTKTAGLLFHEYASAMPIFDYHSHLSVKDIAHDRRFDNLSQLWLDGDHYKWRAMRANGIEERCIIGKCDDYEKFEAWAATIPDTLRNPLYLWTHMELKKPFGIDDMLLNPDTAKKIYHICREKLQKDSFTTRGLLKQMNAKIVCTTDDPVDDLKYHNKIKDDKDFSIKILPTFRPDKAMAIELSPDVYNIWVDELEESADMDIHNFYSFREALVKRHDYFHLAGCRLSDHGMDKPYAEDYTEKEISDIFNKIRTGNSPDISEIQKFKSAMLIEFARMNNSNGWVQQFHFGALRNTNTRALRQLGPDSGYDSIGDFEIAEPLARFLNNLEKNRELTKTILYNINPRDNELIATMIGNFQDDSLTDSLPGKMQFGSAWWFNDHKDGIKNQINSLSNLGLLSRFIGMLTDSRSFLSFSRHEYFRRILCNLLGNDIENGELPYDMKLIGKMVKNICYNNAINYFDFT